MSDHAVVGAHREPLDMPAAHHGLARLGVGEQPGAADVLRDPAQLRRGGDVAEHHAAGRRAHRRPTSMHSHGASMSSTTRSTDAAATACGRASTRSPTTTSQLSGSPPRNVSTLARATSAKSARRSNEPPVRRIPPTAAATATAPRSRRRLRRRPRRGRCRPRRGSAPHPSDR